MLPGPGHRVQAGGSALGGPFVEEIQNCVGHGHFRQASPAGRGGHRDMPQGELVNVSGGASDAESRRCAVHRAIGQAPHVVQDAEVPFHLQGRPFRVPAA